MGGRWENRDINYGLFFLEVWIKVRREIGQQLEGGFGVKGMFLVENIRNMIDSRSSLSQRGGIHREGAHMELHSREACRARAPQERESRQPLRKRKWVQTQISSDVWQQKDMGDPVWCLLLIFRWKSGCLLKGREVRESKGELKTEAIFEENERQVFQRSLTEFLDLVQSHCRLVISYLR